MRPRAFSESYVDVMTQQAADAGVAADPSHVAALARALAERVGYELTTAAHEAIWAVARPLLLAAGGGGGAAARAAADAARRPHGGRGRRSHALRRGDAAPRRRQQSATARPILAVHMRRGEGMGRRPPNPIV